MTMLVGVLPDFAISEEAQAVLYDAINLAFQQALDDGLIDRPVELVVRHVDGLPRGRASDVLTAWKELADQGVLAIFGPWSSENALAIRTYVEEQGRIPTLAISGSDRWYGKWCFSINNGSLGEEPKLLTNYLGSRGVRTVAVLHDKSATGEEYRRFFRDACAYDRIDVVFEQGVNQVAQEMLPVARRVKESGAEAVVYFGFGLAVLNLNDAFRQLNWERVRVMGSGFMAAPFVPGGLPAIRGWVGVDQYDEQNDVGQEFLDDFENRYGYRPAHFFSQLMYDGANLVAHALGNAFPLSPEGVREGFEQIKFLPAATGGAGSVLSFAPHVHRAWMTPHFIVLREVETDLVSDEGLMRGGPGHVMRHRFRPRTRAERQGPRQ